MTAPDNHDELCKRLEHANPILVWTGGSAPEPSHDEWILVNPDGPEAAAAIRALEGERDAAIAALRAIAKDSGSTTRLALREHAADALASLDTEKAGG